MERMERIEEKIVTDVKKKLRTMVDSYSAKRVSEKARNELTESVKALGKSLPNLSTVLFEYPSFEHVTMKVAIEGKIELSMSVNPRFLKADEDAMEMLSCIVASWVMAFSDQSDPDGTA